MLRRLVVGDVEWPSDWTVEPEGLSLLHPGHDLTKLFLSQTLRVLVQTRSVCLSLFSVSVSRSLHVLPALRPASFPFSAPSPP